MQKSSKGKENKGQTGLVWICAGTGMAVLLLVAVLSFPPLWQREYAPVQPQPIYVEPQDRVNLNTAPLEEITALPGIGDKRAKAIVDHREKNGAFHTVEELAQVPGIGDKMVASLKNLVCL